MLEDTLQYKYVEGPKIPRNCKKNYLKYLYKFETLVSFEVLPLRLMLSRTASESLAALDSISV